MSPYPEEILDEDLDDGTMPDNVATLADAVVGHRIVSVTEETREGRYYGSEQGTVLTLDNGKRVWLMSGGDCCAYTELDSFLLHPELVDHAILGIGTTDGYTTWHIYCDLGDILQLDVSWSAGNIGYYGYGFSISVVPLED